MLVVGLCRAHSGVSAGHARDERKPSTQVGVVPVRDLLLHAAQACMALVFLNLSPMAAGSRCCCSVGSIPCVPRLLGKLVYPPSYFAGGATVGSSANVHCGEADELGRLVQRKHFCIVKHGDYASGETNDDYPEIVGCAWKERLTM